MSLLIERDHLFSNVSCFSLNLGLILKYVGESILLSACYWEVNTDTNLKQASDLYSLISHESPHWFSSMVCFAGVSLILRKDHFLGFSLVCELENNLPFSSLVSWEGVCAITAIPQFPVCILAIIVQVSVKR